MPGFEFEIPGIEIYFRGMEYLSTFACSGEIFLARTVTYLIFVAMWAKVRFLLWLAINIWLGVWWKCSAILQADSAGQTLELFFLDQSKKLLSGKNNKNSEFDARFGRDGLFRSRRGIVLSAKKPNKRRFPFRFSRTRDKSHFRWAKKYILSKYLTPLLIQLDDQRNPSKSITGFIIISKDK